MPAKRHYTSYTKEELQNSRAWELQLKSIESILFLTHLKYDTEEPEYNYISCKHCGGRFVELRAHLKKFHNQTTDEYKKQFSGALVVAPIKANKIAGENNPGYQHGGKLSAYSDKFVKYEGKTTQEIEAEKQDVIARANQTRQDNPERQPTRIEYYLAKGMSETEAKVALSKRQSTFSLEKCIEKYGTVHGKLVWEARQSKWLESLSEIPPSIMEEYTRKKSNQKKYFEDSSVTEGRLYFIKVNPTYYKIGITKNTTKERYDKYNVPYESVLYESDVDNIHKLSMVEKIIKMAFTKYALRKNDEILPYGWTESFSTDAVGATEILIKIKSIIDYEKDYIDDIFESVVRASK